MFSPSASTEEEKTKDLKPHNDNIERLRKSEDTEATRLKGAIRALGELHGNLSADLTFAKREMAYGNLRADDIDEMFKLFRKIILPLTGMSSVADIFERVAEKRGWTSRHHTDKNTDEERKDMEKKELNEIMKTLHIPFETMTEALGDGLQHVLYTLKLAKPPKKKNTKGNIEDVNVTDKDVEAHGNIVGPGETGYAAHLAKKIDKFYEQRKSTLAIWCKQKGIDLYSNALGNPQTASKVDIPGEDLQTHQRNKRQLYLILYVSLPFIYLEFQISRSTEAFHLHGCNTVHPTMLLITKTSLGFLQADYDNRWNFSYIRPVKPFLISSTSLMPKSTKGFLRRNESSFQAQGE